MKKITEMFEGNGTKSENNETPFCCCGGGHSHQQFNSSLSKTVYQCPMKCEGEKTYDAPGKCPVCKMQLVPING